MSSYTLIPINFNPFKEEKEIDKIVFTNEPQKEIWLSCIIGGDASNLAYNESVSLDLTGVFYPDYFSEAIKEVVQRHEALRATVSANGETLIIYKNIPFEISIEDISTQMDQKSILDAFITDQMQYVFDLQEGPLFKSYLHKLNETHYYFTIVKHHIIGDGWSTGVILEDLSKLYNAKVRGENLQLPPAPQISTYAKKMANSKFTLAYQLTQDYWLNMYKNEVPVLDLPIDFPRPALRTYKSHRIDSSLSLELIDQLKVMGAKAGCSLVNTLLTVFEVFLYLQTNQRDIVVGLPTAGQSATGDFGLVGHCVNLLPLRSIIDTNSTFNTYLKNRKSAFFDAYDHQQFTYGQLVKHLNLKRDHSRIPLAPVVFNIDMGMDNLVAFDHLNYHLISNPRGHETFEIFLNATGSKTAFIFEWSYNTQLFKPETIDRMAKEFRQLLQVIVKEPDIIIKEISLGNTKIWKEQLALWNNTYSAYPKDKPFMCLIDKYGFESPQKTALVYKNESLNYFDLIERSNQFASYLIAKGIKVGDIIALASNRSVEMLICLLGILKSGAVYVPLDPEYPLERIEFMLSDSNAKILLVSKIYAGRFKSTVSELVIEDLKNEVKNYQKQLPAVQITGKDVAYILYTSGSTGKPKGVQIKHHNLMNFLISMQSEPGITKQDRLLAITTISFDIAGLELYLPLISGAELIICDSETAKDGRLLLDLIKAKNVTFMQATPSTWRMMVDSGWTKSPSLKVLCGGEALPKELADVLIDKSAELWNMYGPTETTIWSTIKKIQKDDQVLTIGRPIQNTQIYILNEENNLLAPGITGEIFIGGEGVAVGYLNREELTKERFIDDSFGNNPDARLYKTGDLGKFLENGEILYQGRIDQQIKIRGHRIELGEIEAILSDQEEIKQAVVIAKEDNLENKRLVAYVVLANNESTKISPSLDLLSGAKPNDFARAPPANEVFLSKAMIDHLRNSLSRNLPDYMIPSDFVALKAFPLTPNHKIDKNTLPQPQSRLRQFDMVVQELNEYEKIISDIWASTLGLENIHIKDDFFELGGHSLLAVKVMAGIEKETGKRLPLATLFENSTIESLAKKIQRNSSEKWVALVPIRTTGTKDPVFLIHGGGLNVLLFKTIAEYLDEDQPVYGIQALGLYKEMEIPDDLTAIAAYYVAEILSVNPDGPYAIAGYSLGGFFAFEIAKQLSDMGKEIKLLGVMDTYAGNHIPAGSVYAKISRKIKRQFLKIPFLIKSFLEFPNEFLSYQQKVLRFKVRKTFITGATIEESTFTDYEKRIYKQYDRAHNNYKLTPFDVKITLFRVKKRLYYLDDLVYLGWNEYAKKGIDVYEVSGDHKTFLLPPMDKNFAMTLQKALNS